MIIFIGFYNFFSNNSQVDNATNSMLEICLFYLEKDFSEFGGTISQLQNIWTGLEFVIEFMNSFNDYHFKWFTLDSLGRFFNQ